MAFAVGDMAEVIFLIVLLNVTGYVLRVRNVCGKIEVLADSEK